MLCVGSERGELGTTFVVTGLGFKSVLAMFAHSFLTTSSINFSTYHSDSYAQQLLAM